MQTANLAAPAHEELHIDERSRGNSQLHRDRLDGLDGQTGPRRDDPSRRHLFTVAVDSHDLVLRDRKLQLRRHHHEHAGGDLRGQLGGTDGVDATVSSIGAVTANPATASTSTSSATPSEPLSCGQPIAQTPAAASGSTAAT